jgi:hypothetical protein
MPAVNVVSSRETAWYNKHNKDDDDDDDNNNNNNNNNNLIQFVFICLQT